MTRRRSKEELRESLDSPYKNQKRSAVREIAGRPGMIEELEPTLVREAVDPDSPVSEKSRDIILAGGTTPGVAAIMAKGDRATRTEAFSELGRRSKRRDI